MILDKENSFSFFSLFSRRISRVVLRFFFFFFFFGFETSSEQFYRYTPTVSRRLSDLRRTFSDRRISLWSALKWPIEDAFSFQKIIEKIPHEDRWTIERKSFVGRRRRIFREIDNSRLSKLFHFAENWKNPWSILGEIFDEFKKQWRNARRCYSSLLFYWKTEKDSRRIKKKKKMKKKRRKE